MFAEAIREGSYLEATIDTAVATALGPAPDVRRILVPIGPVAVFGSSNFPFAFSVPGGDTASALAAACPVVLKAHGSHPVTSRETFATIESAARASGAPAGSLGIVYGTDAGTKLVADSRIRAVGFTGSLGAATALQAVIDGREEPIPFYGELSSVNPLVISHGAAIARADLIGEDLFASFTGSAGQLCTKPGVAFVPTGPAGDTIVADLARRTAAAEAQPLLNVRIHRSLADIRARLIHDGGAKLVARSTDGDGLTVGTSLLVIDADSVTSAVTEEAFGPLMVVVRYRSNASLEAALRRVPKSLTATFHVEEDELAASASLLALLEERAGRLVFNGYPTGVRVSWAQHHGGPWPATNTVHTSVGVSAIRRFQRPLAWQNAPQMVLPLELRDGPVDIPRRVDGRLVQASGEIS